MTKLLRALGLVPRDSRDAGVISFIPRFVDPARAVAPRAITVTDNIYSSPEFQSRLAQAKARLGDHYLAAKANHVKRLSP